MCFEPDSLPPIPVLSGAAVSHDELVLEAVDGNRFAAFAATPDEPGATGVVVLPDVRGLYRFYEELALRFAARGRDPGADPGAAGGRRPEHHGRAQRGLRRGTHGGRRRARGGHLPGRAAQLLRPEAGRVRGRVRRRLAPRARVRRVALIA